MGKKAYETKKMFIIFEFLRQNEFYIFSMLSITDINHDEKKKININGDDIHIYYIFIGILFSINVPT